MDVGNQIYDVIAADGDASLGSIVFARRIKQWLVEQINVKIGIDLTSDAQIMKQLHQAAVQANEDLMKNEVTTIELDATTTTGQLISFKQVLTLTMFNELCADLISASQIPLLNILQDAQFCFGAIDQVILVGYGAQIAAVKAALMDEVKQIPREINDATPIKATGAAKYAGILNGQITDTTVLDVTPFTIFVAENNGALQKVMRNNTLLPTSTTWCSKTTNVDGVAKFKIYQGAQSQYPVGEFSISELLVAQHANELEFTLNIDRDGIISMQALNLATMRVQNVPMKVQRNILMDSLIKSVDNIHQLAPTRYYPNAHATIAAAFDQNQYRFWDQRGLWKQIEAPADQYKEVVFLMQELIING